MKSLAFTHIVEHENWTKHLFLSQTLRDGTGDRQALNMVEIALGEVLLGMYVFLASQKALRQQGHSCLVEFL